MAGDSADTGASGPTVESGSRVVLVVSRGPHPQPRMGATSVPALLGKEQGEALKHLLSANLNAQVFSDANDAVKRGQVIDQFPPAGARVAIDSEVVVLVSAGPAANAGPASLPDVVGLPEGKAVAAVRGAALEPEIVRDYHPNVAEGIVIAQLPTQATIAAEKPRAGSLAWVWVAVAIVLVGLAAAAAFALIIGKQVAVPNVTGLEQSQAEQALTALGLRVGGITPQTGSTAAEGSILAQTPQPGVEVRSGSSVALVVAAAKPKVGVPNVVGLSAADAGTAIGSAGLIVQVTRKFSDSAPRGTVVDQSPGAGQMVEQASAVTISISLGPQSTTVTLPNFAGLTQSAAVSKAVSLGLTSRISNAFSATAPAGQVIDQIPDAGQTVGPGTTIGLNVSSGLAPANTVTVPDLSGQTSTYAIATLGGLGLTYTTVQWDGTGQPVGNVSGQLPKASEQVATGGSVVMFVSSGK